MRNFTQLVGCAGFATLLSGCATFGTNVEGDFSCRAPKGNCAPSQVIDAAATSAIDGGSGEQNAARVRTSVANDDITRTSERKLRILFPAHVDETGTLHDEAVAWAVIESPRWAAELRRRPGEDAGPALIRQLKRQLRSAQIRVPAVDAAPDDAIAAAVAGDGEPQADDASPFSLTTPPSPDASPPALPSTAREAVAGAQAPAVEGFDMLPPPHDRTPRPFFNGNPPQYPSAEAIDAAKAQAEPKAAQHPATQERK